MAATEGQQVLPQLRIELPSGFDGLLRSVEATQQELRRTVQEMKVANEQNLVYNRRSLEAIEETQRQVAEYQRASQEVLERERQEQQERRSRRGGAPGTVPPSEAGGAPGGSADPAARILGSGQQTVEDILSSRDLDEARRGQAQENAYDVYRQSQGRPIASLREDLFRRASQRMSTAMTSRDQAAVESLIAEGLDPAEVMAEMGSLPGGSSRAMMMGRNVLGGVSEQGFAGGARALMSGLRVPAAAGLIGGAVVGGTNAALSFAENQRRQNMEFQSVLGGSNFEGFGERARQRMFRWSQRGVMGGAEAEQLFSGVTRLGMRDEERGEALDAATGWFRRFGMSAQESVALIREASQNGVQAFTQLTVALDGVTESAREAGVNAQEARQQFTQQFQAINAITGGPQSAALAGSITQAQMGMGRQLSGLNVDPFSQQQLYMMAGQTGTNINDIMAMLGTHQGQVDVAQWRDQQVEGTVHQLLGGRGQEAVARFLEGQRRAGRDTEDISDAAWNQFAAQELVGLMDMPPEAAMQMLNNLHGAGIRDVSEVPQYLARHFAGQGRIAPQLEADRAALEGGSIEERGGLDEWVESLGFAQAGDRTVRARGSNMTDEQEEMLRSYMLGVRTSDDQRTEPVIEQMLRSGEFGPDTMFEVETADGRRVVSMRDALHNFRDQLASGQAIVASGDSAGSFLGDVLGTGMDDDVDVTSTQESAPTERHGFLGLGERKVGESVEEYEARMAEERRGEGGGSGRVVIQPSPRLEALLDFMGEGNVDIQYGRYEATPPAGSMPPGFEN